MDFRNVGGTPGGTKTFLLGIVLVVIGGYLLLQQVTVHGGYWNWGLGGYGRSFGITLIPLLLGVVLLFANGKSLAGRILTAGGALVIVVGIIANMDIHIRQTSLWTMLLILMMLVAGIGLVVRAVMPMEQKPAEKPAE